MAAWVGEEGGSGRRGLSVEEDSRGVRFWEVGLYLVQGWRLDLAWAAVSPVVGNHVAKGNVVAQ